MPIRPIRAGVNAQLRNALLVAGALVLSLVAPAHSAVYKCKAQDGSASYSDKPCDQKTEVIDVTQHPVDSKPSAPSSSQAGQPADVTPAAIPQGQDKPAPDTTVGLCTVTTFNAWLRAQGQSQSDLSANRAKLLEINNQCRRSVGLPELASPARPAPVQLAATNAALEDELHPKRPCIRLGDVKSSSTPMELYGALRDCLQNNRDADAVSLFVLAGMDSAFDAMRVADKTAGQARQILIMDLVQSMSPEVHARFVAAMQEEDTNQQRHAAVCEAVKKLGPPKYFPAYMVNHGMGAVQSALKQSEPPAAIDAHFDAAGTWTSLLANYAKCK